MSLAEWISIAGVVVAALGVIVAIAAWIVNSRAQAAAEKVQQASEAALSEQGGRHRERLDTLERWQRDKSIDRSEFDDLSKRVADVEGEVKGVGKVEKDVAVLSEQVKGFRELVGRDVEELKHTSRNIRQSIDTLGKQITDLVSRPH